ncbi:MAG: hypothetical protein M1835_002397 [Candelina submexicana]|nr:MAG: hypothetical protein M1835_002397 [Candelina submexicana]
MLYCSESCRKKDNYKTPTYPSLQPETPLRISPLVAMETDNCSHRDIIPQASPRAPTTDFPSKLPPLNTSHEARQKQNQSSNIISDAHNYLLQFHRTTSTPTSPASSTVGYATPYTTYVPVSTPYRPTLTHSNTTSTTFTTTPPSLTHSSSSSSSSITAEYNFSTRPLPPRHDPQSYSACSRSIDLVTPHLSTAYSGPNTLNSMVLDTGTKRLSNGELLYEKRWTLPSMEPRRGSLQELFDGQHSKAEGHSQSVVETTD